MTRVLGFEYETGLAHNALALCIMSLLIADISEYLCLARVRTLQIEVD